MYQTVGGQRRPIITCPENSQSDGTPNSYSMCICNPGYISNINYFEEYECIVCGVGKYAQNKQSCNDCPENSEPVGGADEISKCICAAGYERSDDKCNKWATK